MSPTYWLGVVTSILAIGSRMIGFALLIASMNALLAGA